MPQRLRPLESCLRQTGAVIVCALSTALVIPTHISSVGLPQTADFREIDVYAAGEAELGWLNSTVNVTAREPLALDSTVFD